MSAVAGKGREVSGGILEREFGSVKSARGKMVSELTSKARN